MNSWLGYIRALGVVALTDRTALFDRLPHTTWYRAALDQFLDLLNPSATDVLLDVGSGAGWFALWASRRAGSVIGVDRSAAMVRQANANRASEGCGDITFMEGDAYHLPFPDGHFDLATGTMLLPVLPDSARAIAEIVRVVRPGGKMATLTPAPSLTPAGASRYARQHGLTGFDRDTLVAWSMGPRRFSEPDLRDLFATHSPEVHTILPLLDGMALASVVRTRKEPGPA